MQRFMFPMRGFHRDFPFVTPAVTQQVKRPLMFPECVGMSAQYAQLRAPRRLAGVRGQWRHIAVTLPGLALERAGKRDVG
jgi:hypothetical protein